MEVPEVGSILRIDDWCQFNIYSWSTFEMEPNLFIKITSIKGNEVYVITEKGIAFELDISAFYNDLMNKNIVTLDKKETKLAKLLYFEAT